MIRKRDKKTEQVIEKILNLGFFDYDYYLENNHDLKIYDMNPLEHYLNIGYKEGRNPSKFFDTNFYLSTNPDVEKLGINPLIHYVSNGIEENRKPLPNDETNFNMSRSIKIINRLNLFDEDYYLENNPDIKKSNVNPLEHYLLLGYKEGRNPSPNFDTNYYLSSNIDVKRKNLNPLIHYALQGINENRPPNPYFNDIFKFNSINFNKNFLTEDIINKMEIDDHYYYNRWEYYKEIIEIVRRLDKIDTILELGPYKSPLVENEDVMDISDDFVDFYPLSINAFYKHDCSVLPYPIEDKQYDLVIACQVLEHLGINGQQIKVFDELERISNKAIISLPYMWFIPYMRDHHRIDENVIDYWANGREPSFQLISESRIIRVYEFE